MSQYDEYGMSTEMMSSPEASYASTGYLEDVLFQFSSKRRRILDDYTTSSPPFDNSSIKKYCSCTSDLIQDFDALTQITKCDRNSGDNEITKKRLLAKTMVVCAFALVKPGGYEGGVTLDDINERILMPPTRPVRHPVGDFACRQLVSPDGPGLSGKAVVSFTRIQTQGRGTITIVRTRG